MDSANGTAARDTLGAALAVADDLSQELGPAVAHAAREAYTSSFRVACIVSAALALGAAIVTVRWVKPRSRAQEADPVADLAR
jgi:DHA2 family multidrug resistance protein-like MFS transporter